jgi:Protein of unknown function (DUF1573)
MSKRIIVMMLASVLSVATIASAQTSEKASEVKPVTEAKAPRLTVVEPIKDFGTVAKGDKLDWSFLIKNTGDADLQIFAAKPGCGCTVADFDKVIKPGETGKVNAHVDTTAFAGPIAKTIALETSDLSTPSAQLTINAIVKPYVEAFPAGFVRFNMLLGDVETQFVTLYSEEDEPFAITKVETPGDWVKVSYAKIEDPAQMAPNVGRPGQAQYKVAITVGGPDARIGPIADKVRFTTTSFHQPQYLVSISGVIRPAFRVEPSGINFGEVVPTDPAATRSILLRSNNLTAPETFSVTKAESSIIGITAAVKPTANRGEYEVTLQVGKAAKAGDLEGNVKIYTNDKLSPVVTIPVRGTVKGTAGSASK